MFEIKYRIIDHNNILLNYKTTDEEDPIFEGYIQISFGSHKEGYYHENSLYEGETGNELLDWWLGYFVDVVNHLLSTKYVAFCVPETSTRWMEFKLINKSVVINIATSIAGTNPLEINEALVIKKYDGFIYKEPLDFTITFEQFKEEVHATVRRFIYELKDINPNLMETRIVKGLLQAISLSKLPCQGDVRLRKNP